MNKYFINITKNLNLKAPIINVTDDDIQSLTKSYENHIKVRKKKKLILKQYHTVSILNQCLQMTSKKKS